MINLTKFAKTLHTKKEWALFCHDYLLNVLHEKDEENWSAARMLKDIYDCHTCVYHIAQVYVKGIIPPEKVLEVEEGWKFNGEKHVSWEEAQLYLERLLNKEKRISPSPAPLPSINNISYEQIKKLENPLVLDVQIESTFKQIYLNPRGISENMEQNIVLICKRGYQSTICADLLLKAGYTNIYVSTIESIYS